MGEEQPVDQLEKIVLQKNNIYILQSLTIYRVTGGSQLSILELRYRNPLEKQESWPHITIW